MRQVSSAVALTIAIFLFGAAIVANVGESHMPEMRGAWVAQALR